MNVAQKINQFTSRDASLSAGSVARLTITLFCVLWGGIAVVVAAALGGVIPLWAATICNAVLLYFTAHINHEAFHRNINGANPKFKWLNDAMGRVISFTFWFSFPAFKAMHLAHHRHLNDFERDTDRWVARRTPFGVALACFSLLNKYEIEMWRMCRTGLIPKRVLYEFYLERLISIGLVVAAFLLGFGTEVVFLWLIPALGILPVIVFLFSYVPHHPHSEGDAILGTNVILAQRWLLPIVTLVFVFQNYHVIHHLYPRVPFYRYGKVFRELRPELEAKGAAIKHLI